MDRTYNQNQQILAVRFDGGCQPNPGEKYGSFTCWLNGVHLHSENRFKLGHGTSNEAEFESLIRALEYLTGEVLSGGYDPKGYYLTIRSDSKILVNRVRGNNRIFGKGKVREASERMHRLATRARDILKVFGGFDILWEPRENNVKEFGH